MQTLDAIIFDFDGTLAELTLDFDLMKRKLAALGEVFLDERPTPGTTPALEWLDELADEIRETDPDEGAEFHTRGRLVITAMELDAARDGRLFSFTRRCFKTLQERGVSTGIITRNITPAVRTIFPDIDDYCDIFIPREDAPRVKPDPAHLLQALKQVGAVPARSLMVGDHPMDIETAKSAGTLSAAVTSGRMKAADFLPFKPDFTACDVPALLDELISKKLI